MTSAPRSRGFTLIEVLIALIIVSVILMASLRSLSVSADTHRRLDLKTVGAWVAEDQAERLRAMTTIPVDYPLTGTVEEGGERFTWRLSLEDAADSPLRRARIRVFYSRDSESPVSELAVFVLK